MKRFFPSFWALVFLAFLSCESAAPPAPRTGPGEAESSVPEIDYAEEQPGVPEPPLLAEASPPLEEEIEGDIDEPLPAEILPSDLREEESEGIVPEEDPPPLEEEASESEPLPFLPEVPEIEEPVAAPEEADEPEEIAPEAPESLSPPPESPPEEVIEPPAEEPPLREPPARDLPAEDAPALEAIPPSRGNEEAPPVPPFLRPAEPEIPQSPRVEVPMPPNPLPELPARPREAAEEPIVFSRIVRATLGQLVEIPFRGTGWVYLGEQGNRQGISYTSRRLDIENGTTIGQTFVFATESIGTYILKFYKRDFIQDYLLNDYVQVIVGERDGYSVTGSDYPGRERVIAEPRWPPYPEASIPSGQSAPDAASTPSSGAEAAGQAQAAELSASPPPASEALPSVSGTPPPAAAETPPVETEAAALPASPVQEGGAPQEPRILEPEEYTRRAREEFDAGRIAEALTLLDEMRIYYPLGTDEALWLYGQLFEAASPARDIKLALENYRKLVREYPQSRRVPDAQRRISYLERYFFNIR